MYCVDITHQEGMLEVDDVNNTFFPMEGNLQETVTIKCGKFYNVHKYSVVVEINAVPEDS